MKNAAFVDYTFVFDPSEVWQHMHQMDDDFNKFFESMGLEAVIPDTLKSAPSGKRLVILRKSSKLPFADKPIEEKIDMRKPSNKIKGMAELKESAKVRDFKRPKHTGPLLKKKLKGGR